MFGLPIAGLPAVMFLVAAAGMPAAGRRSLRILLLLPALATAVWLEGGVASAEQLIGIAAFVSVVTLAGGRERLGVALVAAGGAAWRVPTDATLYGELLPLTLIGFGLWLACDRAVRGVLLLWVCAAAFALTLESVRPQVDGLPPRALEVVTDQFRSRSALPVALTLILGLSLWPVCSVQIRAARGRGDSAGVAVALLGLVTATVLLRCGPAAAGVVSVFGHVTMPIAVLLGLAQSDLRSKIVAAYAATSAFAAAVFSDSPGALVTVVAPASLSAAVAVGVVGRLDERYGSREPAAFRGLAKRHPTAGLILCGSVFGLVASVAGPFAVATAFPTLAARSHAELWWVLLMLLGFVTMLATLLTGILFGPTRVPEFAGPVFERVGVTPPPRRSLAGPASTLAWTVGLLTVAAVVSGRVGG